eukprot:TRINITY_DN52741_c0_g1_i1.p1 TRINITY_DN52741_c0_g1~~TRINITY_DN52741_c0_g1_i1.p1  ORF type:complete len:275 (-),score=47.47 TRINITY_DN52741_c0_g1_i1:140-964(-)
MAPKTMKRPAAASAGADSKRQARNKATTKGGTTPKPLPNLTLYYFNISAKAEPIRLALHYLQIPFTDHRFKDRDEFMRMKTSGMLAFGQVPALKIDEDHTTAFLTQSAAILRYVALLGLQTGLYKRDPLSRLYDPVAEPVLSSQIDALMDQEADATAAIKVCRYSDRFGFGFLKDSDDKPTSDCLQAEVAQRDEILPRHLAHLEKLIPGPAPWFFGRAHPSIADFHWVQTLKQVKDGWGTGGCKTMLDNYPKLLRHIEAFDSLPEVKDYYSNRS